MHQWILWADRHGQATWLWWLDASDAQHTRLLTRLRTWYRWTPPWLFYYLLYDVSDIVMMRACLLGIPALSRFSTISRRLMGQPLAGKTTSKNNTSMW